MADTTHIYQGSLKGSISSSGNISGFLSKKTEVKGSISGSSYSITADIKIPQNNIYDIYDDIFQIIPNWSEQVLYTQGKVVKNNIKIFEIPTYQVSNEYGITFTI